MEDEIFILHKYREYAYVFLENAMHNSVTVTIPFWVLWLLGGIIFFVCSWIIFRKGKAEAGFLRLMDPFVAIFSAISGTLGVVCLVFAIVYLR